MNTYNPNMNYTYELKENITLLILNILNFNILNDAFTK